MVTSAKYGTKNLNVTSFSAPITGTIQTAQLRMMQHHYPIRTVQPELSLQLMFSSYDDFVDFQQYIRNVQLEALTADNPGLTLSFPPRNITNFTGLPVSVVAGAQKFLYSPRCELRMTLIDSMVSQGSAGGSKGTDFSAIYGVGSPNGVLNPADLIKEGLITGIAGIGAGVTALFP